jgi:dTDP-4-dehydrorhamnose reductase
MKKKILVTGAKGQLGKKLIDLLSQNYTLVLTDIDNLDITDKSQVDKVMKSVKPDFVIHAAAYTKVDSAEDEKELCHEINALGTENIALAAKQNNSTLFYISTDYVFDGKKSLAYSETDSPNPLSVYGQTKLDGEKYIQELNDKFYILRVAWLFGELPKNHPGTNFVETMLRLTKENDFLNIVDDQIGSPTYTKDLVETIKEIIEKEPEFGLYHFSGIGECSWCDFAKEIFKQREIDFKVNPITSDQYPQKAKRPSYSYLDKSKIENALKIKVRPWQEMVGEYLRK